MEAVKAQTEEQAVINALGLIVSAREPLMDLFGVYLRSSAGLEAWLRAGAPSDDESARKVAEDIKVALSSLTQLGSAALGIAGVSARVAGVSPDTTMAN